MNLRLAAEQALKYFEDAYGLEDTEVEIKEALRQALAMEPREDELKECVHEFFTKYLNYVEETYSGRPFNPVTIGCCRSLMLEPLNKLLDRMRELSGAEPNPLYEEKKHEG